MNKFGLPQRTIDDLLNYFSSRVDVDKVVIYGSRAKGTFHNGSDIDFAVWSDNPDASFKIAAELDELPTPYKFDVVNYEFLSHDGMKNSIDQDGVLFYQKSISI